MQRLRSHLRSVILGWLGGTTGIVLVSLLGTIPLCLVLGWLDRKNWFLDWFD